MFTKKVAEGLKQDVNYNSVRIILESIHFNMNISIASIKQVFVHRKLDVNLWKRALSDMS